MEESLEIKEEEVELEDFCFAEDGLMQADNSDSFGNIYIKTEDAVASAPQNTASNRNPLDVHAGSSSRSGETLSNSIILPLLPVSTASSASGGKTGSAVNSQLGNIAGGVNIPSLAVPHSNVNASVVSSLNPSVVSSNMNASGIVPGASVILLPTTQQLSTDPMSLQLSDRLPISNDQVQVPLSHLPFPMDPPQVGSESSEGQQEQLLLLLKPKNTPEAVPNRKVESDLAKALYDQSLALNKLLLAVGDSSVSLETFIASGISEQDKFVKVLEQIYKDQDEIRSLVREQDQLVQGYIQKQHQQMVQLLKTMKKNQDEQNRKMQYLQKQMISIQGQMMMWEQDWIDQHKQQTEQLEMLRSVENSNKD